jgi:4-amino-4-deoxy-L-arabinose transferase
MPQSNFTQDISAQDAGRFAFALAGLFVLLFLISLFGRPLFIPDEVRYAEIAREMIVHGNWIVPRLDGLLYFEKPPLGHWLNAMALFVFGENEFAVRVASALSAGGTALIGYFLSRSFFSSRRTALLTVFVYLTCFEVQVLGNFSVLDSILTVVLNGGIAAIVMAARADSRRSETAWLVAGGAVLGLAFLAKGFLAFVVPGIVLGAWLLWERKFELILKRSWLAILAALVVVAPWAVAIHLQEPDFWRYFVVVEHLQRFAAENAQHKAPIYYYLVALPVVLFPWFFLIPAAFKGGRSTTGDASRKSARSLLWLWLLLPFAFFSVASGKLITYILPCFLPFSMLLAHGLDPLLSGKTDGQKWVRIGMGLVALAFLAGLIALLKVQLAPSAEAPYESWELGKFYAFVISLGIAVLLASLAAFSRHRARPILAAGIAIAPLLLTLQYVLPDEVMQHKAPGAFLERVGATLAPDTIVATNGSLVRAVTWHLKRDDVYVIQDKGETAYGLDAPDGEGRFLEPLELGRLIRDNAGRRDILIVCKNPCEPRTREHIPAGAETDSYGNFYSHLIRKSQVSEQE